MPLTRPGPNSDRSLQDLAGKFHVRLQNHQHLHWGRRAAAAYDLRAAIAVFPGPMLVLRPNDDLWALVPRVGDYLQHDHSRVLDLPDWQYGFLDTRPGELAAIVGEFLA